MTLFGIGPSEFVVLAVIALVVLGPEKLPRYAADAARFLRDVRAMVNRARADVRDQLGPEFQDISLSDLNPRTFVSRHVLGDDVLGDDPLGLRDDTGPRQPAGGPRLAPGERPPYDADAT